MFDRLNDLTLKIYDAVADPDRWQPALDQLVDEVGAHGSVVFEWRPENGDDRLTAPLHSGRYSESALAFYLKNCAHLEAQDQAIIRQHTSAHDDVELLDDSLLAQSLDALREQQHVQLLKAMGIFHRAAGVMNKDNPRISLFSVQLGAERDPLTEQERRYLGAVLPHLAKALDLSIPTRQLQARYRSVLTALDQLTLGICVIDAKGRVVTRNEEFRRQQEASRSFRVDRDGWFRLSNPEAMKRLAALMEDVSMHGLFGARPRKESVLSHTDDPLCVEVSPLRRADELGGQTLEGFIVCSTDTSLPISYNTARMREAFALTDAEVSLIDEISHGRTNPEIADRRGRSVTTINAQIKSILSKSGCANRTQFVRMLMRFGTSFLTKS